jgi:RecA-family ATPase
LTIPQPFPFTPQAAKADSEDAREFFCAADLDGLPVPPRRWHVPDLVPAGTVTTLNGDGGTGKSLAALQLAVSTALGRPWLGQQVTPGRALFISAEDDRDEIHRRLADIARAEGVPLLDLDGLTLRSLAGKDTLADLFGGNEVNRAQARQFISLLRRLCVDHDTTVILLAHPSLAGMASGSGSSGSTAWNNSVRSRLYLRRVSVENSEPDPDARELEVMKANYGKTGQLLALRWQEGVFVADLRSLSALDHLAAGAKAERVFLKLLRQANENARKVNHTGGNTYAPKVFSEHPNSEGVSKAGFRRAMESLLAAKTVAIETDGPASRRVSFLTLRREQ